MASCNTLRINQTGRDETGPDWTEREKQEPTDPQLGIGYGRTVLLSIYLVGPLVFALTEKKTTPQRQKLPNTPPDKSTKDTKC